MAFDLRDPLRLRTLCGPLRVLVLLLLAFIPGARAAEITVAVASNFSALAEELASAFTAQGGPRVRFSSASSGQLYAQIHQGAPFDLLLSADEERPARLEQEGLGVAGSRFTYALGRLALWMPAGLPEDDAEALLRAAPFRRLALANPVVAPYGLAARQSLQALGLWESLSARLVYGENISQTFAMVATGNAQAGLVALAQLHDRQQEGAGHHLLLPDSLHEPIRQQAILLRHGADNEGARAFLAFLRGEAARALIRARGYDLE